ncbi:MAG TPA: LysM peptidoglycan-binding domain-containing protein [Anaerolineae bacterium]|nr:LysM peptidoglycan-binding domain-containing protein [Anaerolineae bacterium]
MRRLFFLCTLVLLLLLPTIARADGPSHIVAYGETLYSIARKYSVSPQALADANGITIESWVYAGQRLIIPGEGNDLTETVSNTSPSGIYTVRAGDTLSGLARKFGVSVNALADANNIPPNGFLYTGWQLKIPGLASPDKTPAQKNETANNAPAQNNQPNSDNALAPDKKTNANPPANNSNTNASAANKTPTTTYIVQPGDTLFGIAIHHGVTIQAITIANNLTTTFVFSGQRLLIPAPPNTSTESPNTSAINSGSEITLRDVPKYRQQQTLTCEEAAAAMALRGALTEAQIVAAMPRSDNPFEGIRGATNFDLIGGLTNYGTYAHGLQKGLSKLGHPSTVYYGQPYDKFKESILENLREGRPVIWWTTWRESYQTTQWVKVSNGTSVPLTPYEHTVVIVAASERGIDYHDPYDGTIRFTTWANHQRTSSYFNNMALVVY